jgi:hypothetical protein
MLMRITLYFLPGSDLWGIYLVYLLFEYMRMAHAHVVDLLFNILNWLVFVKQAKSI